VRHATLVAAIAGLIPLIAALGLRMLPGEFDVRVPAVSISTTLLAGALIGFAARDGWIAGLVLPVLLLTAGVIVLAAGLMTPIEMLAVTAIGLLSLDIIYTRRGHAPPRWRVFKSVFTLSTIVLLVVPLQ
jgi:hypothetical protein